MVAPWTRDGSDEEAFRVRARVTSRQYAAVLEEEARCFLEHRGHGYRDNHAEHTERMVADHD